jgi:hypothetical protein
VIELKVAALTPTTAAAAIEKIDLLHEHYDIGPAIRALRALLVPAA